MLNTKLYEIRKKKALMKKKYEELTRQREQAERNYVALEGAEQVLIELIELSARDKRGTAHNEPETEIIEEMNVNDSANNS